MKTFWGRRLLEKAVFFGVGAVIGHLLVHPYAMVSYSLMEMFREGRFTISADHIISASRAIFDPVMLPMTVSFSLFCGFAALMIEVVLDRTRKLHESRIESERKKTAVDTLHRLMVTLSHYLLNANAIIGGTVHHCRKHVSPEDIDSSLKVIEEQALRIDAVIAALRKVTDIRTADYVAGGHDQMLDITKEVEGLLRESDHAR